MPVCHIFPMDVISERVLRAEVKLKFPDATHLVVRSIDVVSLGLFSFDGLVADIHVRVDVFNGDQRLSDADGFVVKGDGVRGFSEGDKIYLSR